MVNEVLRCSDVFLFKVSCPRCSSRSLTGIDVNFSCTRCSLEVSPIYRLDGAHKRNVSPTPKNAIRKRISKRTVADLFKIQEGHCAYCGIVLSNYHVDHITPLCVGGTNELRNLCISCPRCNQRASGLVFRSFYEKQSYLISNITTCEVESD